MNISRRAAMVCVAVILATPAYSDELPPYLTAKQVDLTIMLPPPPAAGSALEKSEMAVVIAAQKNASAERIRLASHDVDETIFAMFTGTLGPQFTSESFPKAAAFFDRVLKSEEAVTDPAKKLFGRVRPYIANPDIKALVKPSASGSYPSGHTTRVTVAAIVLVAMLPERRDQIWARANEYAESRVIGGMHYPADLDAGHRAGTAMGAALFADPAFRADFEVAKAEVRQALGL